MPAAENTRYLARLVDGALKHGLIQVNGAAVHPLAFFAGLRVLWAFASRRLGMPNPARVLERTSVIDRLRVSELVGSWLHQWPHRLLNTIRENKIPVTAISPRARCAPFWIELVVSPMRRKQARLLADEAAAIVAAAGGLRYARIRGRHVERRHLPVERQTTSEEVYQRLVRSLQERASASTGLDARRLHEDVLWVEIVRREGLRLDEVAAMTIAALRELRESWTQAGRPCEVVRRADVILEAATDTATLRLAFPNARTGERLGRNALSERFRKAAQAAGLSGSGLSVLYLRPPGRSRKMDASVELGDRRGPD
ncbi:hypothetical protein ACPWT1_03955 [Ramlibacter sp. MMS24-I3-19]|uniref:hypothetical protein n=1 Tax=Ramlibacter sp. MMS24-I3-19 TaxID=3416606 RepID=UPI003D01498A